MAITYTPTTNFGLKDSLPTNDPAKVIKGAEFSTEFTAIQTAFGQAAPLASPTFTGTVTIASVDINGGTIDGVTIGGSSAGAGSFTTLTASGDVNFDSGTFFVDASADAVGIGTNNPSNLLTVNSTAGAGIKVYGADQAHSRIAIDNLNGQEWNIVAGTVGVSNSGFGIYDADAGAIRLQIDASGNVGIGGVPNSWSTVTNVLQMKDQTALAEHAGTGYFSQNWYYDGGEKYIGNGYAIRQSISSVDGAWIVANASNNTSGAGAGLTWSERMRIDASGNLGLGVTPNGSYKLEVNGGGLLTGLNVSTGGANNSANTATFDTNGTGAARFYSRGANASTVGSFQWRLQSSDGSVDTQAMTLNASGNLGVGTASPARTLHVNDVMRLEPRATAPSSPSAGDIFFNSSTNKLQCYDGTAWQDCF